MVGKIKHKETIKETIEKHTQDPRDFVMQQVMVGCKIPRIVKIILISEAQSQGILLSELMRKYIYEITKWSNEEIRKRYLENSLNKATEIMTTTESLKKDLAEITKELNLLKLKT